MLSFTLANVPPYVEGSSIIAVLDGEVLPQQGNIVSVNKKLYKVLDVYFATSDENRQHVHTVVSYVVVVREM
jgi:hypothetical protein